MSANPRPAKRSRITTTDAPLDTTSTATGSPSLTTTTCSNINARRLAMSHTVIVRRRAQQAAQTVFKNTQAATEDEIPAGDVDLNGFNMDFGEDIENVFVEAEEAPKRRVVCALFSSKSSFNFLLCSGSPMPGVASPP